MAASQKVSQGTIAVKVCGITRGKDAIAFDRMGVDWLGFNFWRGSKRLIQPAAAANIIQRLKHAVPVGVFVNHTAAEINAIAAQTGIQWVQLHGEEGWDVLDGITLPVIKAIPHTRIADWGGLRADWDAHVGKQPEYFLVDTQTGTEFGGTGRSFDWNLLKESLLPRPFFLAGGLGPENVALAKNLEPYAVDLNSKVETTPGMKDVAKVALCLDALGKKRIPQRIAAGKELKLFVGNLSWAATQEDLEAAFGAYGEVASAKIMTDRLTGKSRGFAFVEMPNDADARRAIQELNGKEVKGRAINVNEARPREERPRAGGDGGMSTKAFDRRSVRDSNPK
ncbi:MAG: phosphoribosylanthranilate isomerase [Fibrobacteria bacterium]|jgi:phosphoribosylanthranilate isomerase|nr:phosphoribosylanthranilate isomerase [Fibrobacteria bacterium]